MIHTNQMMARRLMRAVKMGHQPTIEPSPEPTSKGKPGVWATCSCGWEGRPRPTKNAATATFFWHLENVLREPVDPVAEEELGEESPTSPPTSGITSPIGASRSGA